MLHQEVTEMEIGILFMCIYNPLLTYILIYGTVIW